MNLKWKVIASLSHGCFNGRQDFKTKWTSIKRVSWCSQAWVSSCHDWSRWRGLVERVTSWWYLLQSFVSGNCVTRAIDAWGLGALGMSPHSFIKSPFVSSQHGLRRLSQTGQNEKRKSVSLRNVRGESHVLRSRSLLYIIKAVFDVCCLVHNPH